MKNKTTFNRRLGFQNNFSSSDMDKFESLLKSCDKVLLKATGVFPFDFFPDEITIDESKVNIVFHEFFFSGDVHSISIDMIKDVEVEIAPLFALLRIVPDGYPGHPLEVKHLKKKDAIRARRIIQGLMLAKRQGINIDKIFEEGHSAEEIESLGKTHLTE